MWSELPKIVIMTEWKFFFGGYLGTLWSLLAPRSVTRLNPVTAVAHGVFRGCYLWIYLGWQAFNQTTNSDPWAAKTSAQSIAPVTVRGCLSPPPPPITFWENWQNSSGSLAEVVEVWYSGWTMKSSLTATTRSHYFWKISFVLSNLSILSSFCSSTVYLLSQAFVLIVFLAQVLFWALVLDVKYLKCLDWRSHVLLVHAWFLSGINGQDKTNLISPTQSIPSTPWMARQVIVGHKKTRQSIVHGCPKWGPRSKFGPPKVILSWLQKPRGV